MTQPDFEKAEALAAVIEEAHLSGVAGDVSKAGFDFHRFLWNRSGSAFLARTLEQICTPIFAFHELVKDVTTAKPRGAGEHRQILEAIRGKNADAISNVVGGHINQIVHAHSAELEPALQ